MSSFCTKGTVGIAVFAVLLTPALAQNKAEKRNMELVGYYDLQGAALISLSSTSRGAAGSPTSATTATTC